MTVDDFANNLGSNLTSVVLSGFYANSYGQRGMRAQFLADGRWHWFSVSNVGIELAADEVLGALRSEYREILRSNFYFNKKGIRGFEATVRVAEHCYMLGAANV